MRGQHYLSPQPQPAEVRARANLQTVAEVKARVAETATLPPRLLPIRMVWRGKQLDDHTTLADYTISATTTVHLLEPPPPAAAPAPAETKVEAEAGPEPAAAVTVEVVGATELASLEFVGEFGERGKLGLVFERGADRSKSTPLEVSEVSPDGQAVRYRSIRPGLQVLAPPCWPCPCSAMPCCAFSLLPLLTLQGLRSVRTGCDS